MKLKWSWIHSELNEDFFERRLIKTVFFDTSRGIVCFFERFEYIWKWFNRFLRNITDYSVIKFKLMNDLTKLVFTKCLTLSALMWPLFWSHLISNTYPAPYLFFRYWTEPIHLMTPVVIIASLVQRVFASFIECVVKTAHLPELALNIDSIVVHRNSFAIRLEINFEKYLRRLNRSANMQTLRIHSSGRLVKKYEFCLPQKWYYVT